MALWLRVHPFWHLAPGETNKLWLGTAISHLQLNLEHSGDIFQEYFWLGKIRSGWLSSADLYGGECGKQQHWGAVGEKPRSWADSVGILSHTSAGVKPHYQARGSQHLL